MSSPVGSLIIGSKKFITKARRLRKALGGGMRQAGILAAAGLFSIKNMIERLEEDHHNALELATKLSEIKYLSVDIAKVQTNIIFIYLNKKNLRDTDFLDLLLQNNIKIDYKGNRKFRLVTHHGFQKSNIDTVINTINNILRD